MILKGSAYFFKLPGLQTVSQDGYYETSKGDSVRRRALRRQISTPSQPATIGRALFEVANALSSSSEKEIHKIPARTPKRASRKHRDAGTPKDVQPILKMVFNDAGADDNKDVFELSYDLEMRRLVAKNMSNNVTMPMEFKNSGKKPTNLSR